MSPSDQSPSIDQIKASMRSVWMSGDFGVIARSTAADADALVERLALPPGTRVLDVACGTGNLALPLARRGAIVTGVDIAPNLLAQARDRASAESFAITFDEGDAEQLPYPAASFDAVVSMFGAMFAPRPALVVQEFARVLRPGGRLAMANWNPASFTAAMFRLSAQYVPPPPGIPPSIHWGDEAIVRERLAPDFTSLETELVPITFDIPTHAAGAVTLFRRFFGPIQAVFNRLDPAGQTAFASALESLWSEANVAPASEDRLVIPNSYLQVTAVRR